MKRLLAMLALLVLSVAAFALPTVEQVQAQVQQGHYAQAEAMMQEVVTAKPNSAKAHYLYAEILAHNGRLAQAAQEARLARQLDPKIGFTQPEQFNSFERLLERQQAATPSTPPPSVRTPAPPVSEARGRGVPGWVWGAGIAIVALLVWRMVSARQRAASATTGGMAAPGYGAPGAPAYGPTGAPASGGSGMLGTGLAAAGGFAAGMLAEKMLEGRHDTPIGGSGTSGLVPGMFDTPAPHDAAADELENRPIDFGSGGDWGGDDAGGGSDDGGW